MRLGLLVVEMPIEHDTLSDVLSELLV